MKPTLRCCTPWLAPYPSGLHWTHSKSCPTTERAQKVRLHKPVEPKIEAVITHPSAWGAVGESAVGAYAYHPEGCICVWCSALDTAYIEHWMDRDDDRTLEGTQR